VGRRLVAAEAGQSVVVFGPSQSRKTSGFAVPAILGWEGPVVATSVKADLVGDTLAYRRRRGTVWCFDPTGSTGLPAAGWSPLASAATWSGARRTAASLTEGGRATAGSMTDGDFWYAAATKMLAPLLLAAATGGLGMADVVRWVDTGEEAEVLDLLFLAGVPAAVDAARSLFAKEERQRSSIATTVETVLEPFADLPVEEGGPAGGRGGAVDPAALAGGSNTLFLCAPAHDQRRLSPLFTAVLRQVLEHAYDTVTRTGRPMDPPMLVVLDEAANIAPLGDLDALASTAAGHGVQLVTIWHDLAQITARYGPRAPTVVNNHRAKVFLAGIADPSTLDHASGLIGDEELLVPAFTSGGRGGPSTTRSASTRRLAPPDALRRLPPGEGVLVYGGLPPARLRLRTWFDDPVLAARVRCGEGPS
jgi:type IV secretion system protein VirD4